VNISNKVLSIHGELEKNREFAYLRSDEIVKLSDYVKIGNFSAPVYANAAKRQTIPAFRQEGVWRIAKNYVRNN
jgi:hypothetical protein